MTESLKANFQTAYHAAAANWSSWRDEYNFSGNWSDRALLNNLDLFSAFCSDYKLSRNIPGIPGETNNRKKKEAARVRRGLVMDFFRSQKPEFDPKQVANFAEALAKEARQAKRDLPRLADAGRSTVSASVSLVSKVLGFAEPALIPPMDRLNCKALKASNNYSHFHERFLEAHQELWQNKEVVELYQGPPEFVPCVKAEAFKFRITDNLLMIRGRQIEQRKA